jgi:hypothetical protein
MDSLLFSIWTQSRGLKAIVQAQVQDDRIDEMPLRTGEIELLG